MWDDRDVVIVWKRRDRQIRAELLAGRDFSGRNFDRARLVDLDLRDKHFPGASLHRADLTEADLRGADLRDANLSGAYLTGARLRGADLSGANLDGAYLIATELDGASIGGASMNHIIFDQATTWPLGYRPPRPQGISYWHGAR